MTESIVAAAASRIGKTVLHLDTNDYYGGTWASFNLENISKLKPAPSGDGSSTPPATKLKTDNVVPLFRGAGVINFKESWLDFQSLGEVNGWNQEKIQTEYRRFNIDLAPHLLFCRGPLVDLLITSNISRYAEFRAVDRVATVKDATIKTVPCSRSDVFTNKDVNVVEKRLLMKFLASCMNYAQEPDEFKGYEEKTFLEFLKHKKLTKNLMHYVLYAIAMGDERTRCMDGVKNVERFLSSLGRFGNTPFLFPMYGNGEIPQCFCRLCAVFGGIYCLSSPTQELQFSNENGKKAFSTIDYEGHEITATNIVLGPQTIGTEIFLEAPESSSEPTKVVPDTRCVKCGALSRAIFITATPIGGHKQNTGGGGVVFLKLPPVEDKNHSGAFVIHLSHYSGTVPKGLFLTHITCEQVTTPEEDLAPYVNQILKTEVSEIMTPSEEDTSFCDEQPLDEETIPTILWSCYFNIPRCIKCENFNKTVPSNVRLACGPCFELDFDASINQAKEIFKDLYPDEEFLPRAPDPDEIVCEGEDATAPKIEYDPLLEAGDTEAADEQQEGVIDKESEVVESEAVE